jgi:hypothetical protein
VAYTYTPNGSRRTVKSGVGTDYYGVDAQNNLLWVDRGTDAAPTSGQAGAYTLFGYDLNGRVTYRDRRHKSGLRRTLDLFWDGDDHFRQVKEGSTTHLTASYDGFGLRSAQSGSAHPSAFPSPECPSRSRSL